MLDGALANPFAHALMQCLADRPGQRRQVGAAGIEVELYRTRPIEVDDTACLRLTLASGLPIMVAVTLCGEDFIAGEIIVHRHAGAGRCWSTRPTGCACPASPSGARCRDGWACWRTCWTTGPTARCR